MTTLLDPGFLKQNLTDIISNSLKQFTLEFNIFYFSYRRFHLKKLIFGYKRNEIFYDTTAKF